MTYVRKRHDFELCSAQVKETEAEERARLDRYAKELEEAEMDPRLEEQLRREQELSAAEAQLLMREN